MGDYESKSKSDAIFTDKLPTVGDAPKIRKISSIPKHGDSGPDVLTLKAALKDKGFALKLSNERFGSDTKAELAAFQKSIKLEATGALDEKTMAYLGLVVEKKAETKPVPKPEAPKPVPVDDSIPVNPAYIEARKYEGKKESDAKFGAWLSGYWGKAGLPHYKSIVGSKNAWCGLFIVAFMSIAGQQYATRGASAKAHDKMGVAINWQVDGWPDGAVVRINHGGKCVDGSGNHVTFSAGICTAADLLKAGATFAAYGGNQANSAKVSSYSVKEICSVRWPKELKFPPRITKSVKCSSGLKSNESTR